MMQLNLTRTIKEKLVMKYYNHYPHLIWKNIAQTAKQVISFNVREAERRDNTTIYN